MIDGLEKMSEFELKLWDELLMFRISVDEFNRLLRKEKLNNLKINKNEKN